ncbi:MAG: helix-turn-helix transcriptional regulator, partial [Clostridia bacterium]|nr:helix-turn-helix transcriptional regulator [Clostridia bacterium]
QSYQAYESGLTMPTAENLLKICLVLNVTLDYLFEL